jgi:hypothetical protein
MDRSSSDLVEMEIQDRDVRKDDGTTTGLQKIMEFLQVSATKWKGIGRDDDDK